MSNESNNDQIIKMISNFLTDDSQTIINSADITIVSTVLGNCMSRCPVVVVADDKDISGRKKWEI